MPSESEFDRLVKTYEREHEEWVRSPLPHYFHSCWRHIHRMGHANGTFVQRCACGGINVGGMWLEKNSERAFHRAERKRLSA